MARLKNPAVARAFDLYLICRTTQLFHMKLESKNKVEHKVAEYVTGYAQLPEAGGVNDQDLRTMALFDRFKEGENAAAMKALK